MHSHRKNIMVATEISPAIRNSVFFEQLDEVEQHEILSACSNETWQNGRSVLAQSIDGTIYFIVSGHIKSVRTNVETGRTVTLFLFGPGDIFDVLQLLHGPSDETVFEAYGDVSLMAVPQSEVCKWIFRYPEFNHAILPYLGKMIAHLEELASDLALHDTETRLAHLIIRHLEASGHNGIHLINNMNHENLAQMIGSVRTVVNRQLQHWRQDGIIATDNGKITVKKLETLLKKVESHMPFAKHDKP